MTRARRNVVSVVVLVCFSTQTAWAYEPHPAATPAVSQEEAPPPPPPTEGAAPLTAPPPPPGDSEPAPQGEEESDEEPAQPPARVRPYRPAPRYRAHVARRRGRGLLTSGIVILAIGYGFTALFGVILLLGSNLIYSAGTASRWQTVGGTMLVPVAGPWIGMALEGQLDVVQLAFGVVQLLGTGLLIGGIAQRSASTAALPVPAQPRLLSFGFSPLPGGGAATLFGAF